MAFTPVPAVTLAVIYFGRRIHDRFERIQAMFSELSARVQENLSGMRVVKAYAQEEAEIAQFRAASQEFVRHNIGLVKLWGMFYPLLQVLIGLAFVIVLWMGGLAVDAGRISLGSFVAFNVYLVQLTWPMIALGWVVNLAERGAASTERIRRILEEPVEIASPAEPARLGEIHGEIEFRNLSFAYDGRPVLRNVNLRIPAGQTVAVVGHTGSGKTTLVNLIPRLFDAPPGTVLLDGVDIRQWSLEALRRQIGFVPQETFLFSDTLRENIAFGAPEAEDASVRWAAEVAGLLPDVEEFPEKFQTLVGERGHHPERRTEAAHRHRPRPGARPPAFWCWNDALSSVDTYNRGAHPDSAGRNDAGADLHSDFPPRLHRPRRRLDRGAGAGGNRRGRHPRRIAGAWRLLRRSLSEATARGGTRESIVSMNSLNHWVIDGGIDENPQSSNGQ